MGRWLVSQDADVRGPLAEQTILDELALGTIRHDAVVRQASGGGWVPVTRLPALIERRRQRARLGVIVIALTVAAWPIRACVNWIRRR